MNTKQDRALELAERTAWLAIGIANTQAELGLITGEAFDSMGELFQAWKYTNADIAEAALVARRELRCNEWGIEFTGVLMEDLPLPAEWAN